MNTSRSVIARRTVRSFRVEPVHSASTTVIRQLPSKLDKKEVKRDESISTHQCSLGASSSSFNLAYFAGGLATMRLRETMC